MCFAHINNILTVYSSFPFDCFIILIGLLEKNFRYIHCLINKPLLICISMFDYNGKQNNHLFYFIFLIVMIVLIVYYLSGVLLSIQHTLTHAVVKITLLNRLIHCSYLTDEIIEAKCSPKCRHFSRGKVGIWVGLI